MQAPVRGRALRGAVIRGDLSTVGVVLAIAGVGLAVAALAGALPVWTAALGVVLFAVGVAAVRWSRAAWRALLAEVARAHAGFDPGPSPVPWIDDRVWRARNRFDPELDAPLLLLAEDEPLVRGFGHDAGGAFTEVTLRPVSSEERELTPVPEDPPEGPVPEGGDAQVLRERLQATPGRFIAVAPRWPVCCGRPTTLESLKLEDRDPRATWLPPVSAVLEHDPTDPHGVHGYRCRTCGRRYATDPAW